MFFKWSFGNISFLLCFLLLWSPNVVWRTYCFYSVSYYYVPQTKFWEHIVFTLFLLLLIIIIKVSTEDLLVILLFNYYMYLGFPPFCWKALLICFCLLRFSVSAENLIVILKFFLYYYYFSFFLQILCRQVLGDGWFDVRQIFRDDRYWLEVDRFFLTLIITSDIEVLTIFRGVHCPRVFSETVEVMNLKFSAIVKEAL
jgi:hypothetical protein